MCIHALFHILIIKTLRVFILHKVQKPKLLQRIHGKFPQQIREISRCLLPARDSTFASDVDRAPVGA